jgi:hypothetical protein
METESKAAKATSVKRVNGRRQRGYTLLEYCAGAAVVAATLGVVLTSMKGSFDKFTMGLNTWATAKSAIPTN